MTTVKAVVQNRRVEIAAPEEIPDGTEVILTFRTPHLAPDDLTFMTEEEQSDDPAAIQKWLDDLHALPPVEFDPEKLAEWEAWQKKMKDFNIEAVRKQFEGGAP